MNLTNIFVVLNALSVEQPHKQLSDNSITYKWLNLSQLHFKNQKCSHRMASPELTSIKKIQNTTVNS